MATCRCRRRSSSASTSSSDGFQRGGGDSAPLERQRRPGKTGSPAARRASGSARVRTRPGAYLGRLLLPARLCRIATASLDLFRSDAPGAEPPLSAHPLLCRPRARSSRVGAGLRAALPHDAGPLRPRRRPGVVRAAGDDEPGGLYVAAAVGAHRRRRRVLRLRPLRARARAQPLPAHLRRPAKRVPEPARRGRAAHLLPRVRHLARVPRPACRARALGDGDAPPRPLRRLPGRPPPPEDAPPRAHRRRRAHRAPHRGHAPRLPLGLN